MDRVAPVVPGHVDYLDRWHSYGVFLASGQTEPEEIGGVILAAGPRELVEKVAAEDPFVLADVAAYEIISVNVARAHPELGALLESLGEPERAGDR